MRALARFLAFIVAVFLLPSCSDEIMVATGESDDLVIVADADVTPEALEALVAVAHTGVPWLLGEPSFKTTIADPSKPGDLLNRRHVLLLGVWSGGDVARLAERRLSTPHTGEEAQFRIEEDVWARGQVVGSLIGRDEDELVAYMASHGNEILDRLETALVGRLARTLREDRDAAAAATMLHERYGWSLAPPTGYDLVSGAADQGFVYLRRTGPDRNVFVRWVDGQASDVSAEFATAERQEMCRLYYDGDEIEWRRPFAADTVSFGGREAVRLSGWWANRRLIGGGPFRLYCFAAPEEGRVYLVDASLYGPGLDKVPLMRNLDAIVHTFASGAREGN